MNRTFRFLWRSGAVGLLALTAVFLSAGLAALLFPAGKERIKEVLADRLIKSVDLQVSPVGRANSNNVIYVLGGPRQSLERKFFVAAQLYHRGAGSRIMVLSRAGAMEYAASIKRNVTYDEWTTQRLSALGVRKEDIEPVRVDEGFFGTLSEAKAIPSIASSRDFSGLILVTSPYHTRRAWETFNYFAEGLGLKLYIYSSDEKIFLRNILLEYLKVVFYRIFLIH